jgi:Xaa-Pro aminopeptidase
MSLDVPSIQRALAADRLDGWLLYDFHGSNPIAQQLTGLNNGPHMTTRRWYYLIPATGEPRALVHVIEQHNLDHLPGTRIQYAGRQQLDAGLTALLGQAKRVAMEYSPDCAIPYVSRVDAGTVEAVRKRGVEIVSSGDLVQQFEATWSAAQLELHLEAAAALYRIKDRAFEEASGALTAGRRQTEYDLQSLMVKWFREEGLVSDAPPVVAIGANAGNPHYLPTSEQNQVIVGDEVLLLDLWGKKPQPGAVYADITWVGATSRQVPAEAAAAFAAIVSARDRAVQLVQERALAGEDLRGWQVDKAARAVLEDSGYGKWVLHRTGHSLGENVHGNGTHLDDYETHDERRIVPKTGFTIEPGLYFERFGVRTEINVYRGDHDAEVTGERQQEIVTLR